MNNLKTYSKYKDTEVPELGRIPEHWETIRLRQMGSFSKGSGGTKEDEVDHGVPCIRYGDLYTYHKYFITKSRSFLTPQRAEEYTPIEKGDILFTTSDVTIRNVGKSAVNLLDPPVYCGPDLIILRPRNLLHHRFAGYLLDSPYAQAQKARAQRGVTIMHIYESQLGDILFGVPPLEEQTAIARYLDDADQRIRAYVSAKERLIALLEEERQAVIHQAVTRGLDPNAKLKHSGVEWLGDVPEHWEVRRLKQVSTIQAGLTLGKAYRNAELIERPYLRVANVQSGHLDLSEITTVQVPLAEVKKTTLEIGDVLMTEGGDIDKLGRGCMWQGEIPGCLHQNHVFAVRPNPTDLNPAFLVTLMGTVQGRNYFHATAKQTTNLAATNRTTLGEFPMYLPSIREQQAIVDHITKESSARDAAIERARRQIELVEEYRTRLIADVVTGKLDVGETRPDTPDTVRFIDQGVAEATGRE